MERIFKHFWHQHGSDENPRELTWEERTKKKYGLSVDTCDDCQKPTEGHDPIKCDFCLKDWHVECVPSSPDEVNHSFHTYHPLKLLIDGPPDYSDGKCGICKQELKSFFYHCSICYFSMHVRCSNDPPPPIVDAPRCHEHTLTLMARDDIFTCNACGMHGERCPYVCAPCGLMFHRDCIKLPHVININRHDHRVSHIDSPGFGLWKCMICHKKIDWRYGAYSCQKCPNLFFHSKCATRSDVWDGEELEGIPEEFVDVSPFKVIEDGVINHFSHEEHNLRLIDEDAIDRHESIRCEACTGSIFSEKHYSCMEYCDYFLHETCANLLLQKRHGLCTKPLTLLTMKKVRELRLFTCTACRKLSNGFRYECGDTILDVRCASMSWYCDYECHPHTLFLTTLDEETCGVCGRYGRLLHCVECKFTLDFKCATLPKKIKHRCDDHFLSLCFGEKEKPRGKYWCEVCETVLDPREWFYSCSGDCGVVCHIPCVLGQLWNVKPRVIHTKGYGTVKLVLNDSLSRPKCGYCGSHCQQPLMIKFSCPSMEKFFCDLDCFEKYVVPQDYKRRDDTLSYHHYSIY
ncbi:hypothetical protein EUTSA_v10007210mg [Eutrema salsugineum]|uniref:Phorbol-ester/DAG-type domain-containing protein n=1 Tax=Eutrema salsugineum TaxID=72664 RepID=V4KD53_EUTSA|nr:uncharacterized protein LOC18993687 [Eutrema salsugineum]ESQ35650.1 hypothetical protein EUTSA_v10007210mg [Eutrema salsugineum]